MFVLFFVSFLLASLIYPHITTMKTMRIYPKTDAVSIGLPHFSAALKPIDSRAFFGALLVFLLCMFFTIPAISVYSQQHQHSVELEPVPSVFLGVASGINNYSGLAGVGMEALVMPSLSLFGQAGLGSWGTKIGGGFRYYPAQIPFGSAWGIGYSIASGLIDFEAELEVENPTRTYFVLLDLHRVGTLNIDYSYNFRVGRMNKISFHAGYAIRLGGSNHYKVKTPGIKLSQSSEQVMRILQPGGLLLGLSLMIGI